MKTKVLNFVMPVFVFIMAIGLAFATERAEDDQMGYYRNPATGLVEKVEVDCDSTSEEICLIGTSQVFADEELSEELYKTSQ